ncbi:hypothetical protein [Piscirickettsia salmonis]|uniref:hypothetical protein n=1 Tax=Piscirickettsia salmonis TaxID=1238 RepID=UPI00249EE04C|nr:hypothetical protein [Piscirickettsia salmonis]
MTRTARFIVVAFARRFCIIGCANTYEVATLTIALQAWLKAPSIKYQIRDELILKLFFGCHVEPAIMIEHLQAARRREIEFLYLVNRALDNNIDHCLEGMPQHEYVRAVARGGQRCTQATIEWLDETIASLQKLEKKAHLN